MQYNFYYESSFPVCINNRHWSARKRENRDYFILLLSEKKSLCDDWIQVAASIVYVTHP